jgi:hypothetical protein
MASPSTVSPVVGDKFDSSPAPLSVTEYSPPGRRRTSARVPAATRTIVINEGRDTLVILGDGSTILVKGVADIGATPFA